MADLPDFHSGAADRIDVLGFYMPGDGGGGEFRWHPAAEDPPIRGMVVGSTSAPGRWIRTDASKVNDRMAGARIDGRSIDDEALSALAAWVMRSSCRHLVFLGGVRRILAPDAPSPPFLIEGVDDLTLEFPDCEFRVAADQRSGSGAIFNFRTCRGVRTVGTPRFRGNLDAATIRGIAGYIGTWAMQFEGECSRADLAVDCEGIGGTINFHRFPRICIDPSVKAAIVEPGARYRFGDRIQLPFAGVEAEVPPVWRVSSLDPGGGIAGLELLERGRFPHDRGRLGLKIQENGFPLVGGSGAGAKLLPWMADFDAQEHNDKSRNIRCRTRAVNCIYGLQWIYGVDDSEFLIDADFVFRAFVCYGGNWRNRGTIRQRNTCGDSFAGGSAMGLGYDVAVTLIQLPTTATGFWYAGSQCRISFFGGVPAYCKLVLTLNAELPPGRNEAGALFEVEKAALDGTDVVHSRGHIGDFTVGGSVRGRGQGNSGLHAETIVGTNVDTYGAAFARERFSWRFADGFVSEGGGDIALDPASLELLQVGRIRMDGRLSTDPRGEGRTPRPGASIAISPEARIG